jgi:hypothetical protein
VEKGSNHKPLVKIALISVQCGGSYYEGDGGRRIRVQGLLQAKI